MLTTIVNGRPYSSQTERRSQYSGQRYAHHRGTGPVLNRKVVLLSDHISHERAADNMVSALEKVSRDLEDYTYRAGMPHRHTQSRPTYEQTPVISSSMFRIPSICSPILKHSGAEKSKREERSGIILLVSYPFTIFPSTVDIVKILPISLYLIIKSFHDVLKYNIARPIHPRK